MKLKAAQIPETRQKILADQTDMIHPTFKTPEAKKALAKKRRLKKIKA